LLLPQLPVKPAAQFARAAVCLPKADDDAGYEQLIADLKYRRVSLSDNLTILKRGPSLLLPLRRTLLALGFRVRVDDKERFASGFLRRPSDWLVLDGKKLLARTPQKALKIQPKDLTDWQGELYISSHLLGTLAQLDFLFDSAALDLDVSTNLELTLDEHEMARRGFNVNDRRAQNVGSDGTIHRTPYLLASIPTVNLEFSGNLGMGPSRESSGYGISGSAFGDLLYLSADYQVAANTTGAPQLLAELGKNDPNHDLLGPLQATQFHFGSLELPKVPLLVGDRAGLGFTFGNYPVSNAFTSYTANIPGKATGGAQVELYRFDSLVAVEQAGGDGRFQFKNIEIDDGPNHFRIVAIGPNGEVQIESKILYGVRSGPPAGGFRYQFSADQPESSLIGSERFQTSSLENRSEAIAETQIGIGQGSWLSGDLSAVRDAYGTETVAGIGVQSWLDNTLWHMNLSDPSASGLAANFGASYSFGGNSFNLDTIKSLGKSALQNSPLGFATASGVRCMWEGRASVPRGREEFGFGIQDAAYSGFPASLLANYGVETRHFGFWGDMSIPLYGSAPFGIAEIRAPLHGINGRADVDYNFSKPALLQSTNLSLSRLISPRYIVSVNCGLTPETRGSLSTGGAVYRVIGPLATGVSLTLGGEGLRLGLLFSTAAAANNGGRGSLINAGLAEMGRVRVRAFLDVDGSGKFHKGNPPLPDVKVRVIGRGEASTTRADGTCEITNLAPNEVQPISLIEDSLKDPTWVPRENFVELIPRAGRESEVDLAVIQTAEIDGRIHTSSKPIAFASWTAAIVPLGKGDELTSSIDKDGGYIFSRVRPGRYSLMVRDSDQHALCRREINVKAGAYTTGFDLEVNGQ
jgi:hypothetical protein